MFLPSFKNSQLCGECEFWHPSDEQEPEPGHQGGAISRWMSTGTMEQHEDFCSTYCVATEIIPWLFHTELNDKARLGFCHLDHEFLIPIFPCSF